MTKIDKVNEIVREIKEAFPNHLISHEYIDCRNPTNAAFNEVHRMIVGFDSLVASNDQLSIKATDEKTGRWGCVNFTYAWSAPFAEYFITKLIPLLEKEGILNAG